MAGRRTAADDIIDRAVLDSVGLATGRVVELAAVFAVIAVRIRLPAGVALRIETTVCKPYGHAGTLALADYGHFEVADEHVVRKGAIRLHSAHVVVVVGLAVVGHCEFVLVHFDEVRGLHHGEGGSMLKARGRQPTWTKNAKTKGRGQTAKQGSRQRAPDKSYGQKTGGQQTFVVLSSVGPTSSSTPPPPPASSSILLATWLCPAVSASTLHVTMLF